MMSSPLKKLRIECLHQAYSSTSNCCRVSDKLAGDVLQGTGPLNLDLKKGKGKYIWDS